VTRYELHKDGCARDLEGGEIETEQVLTRLMPADPAANPRYPQLSLRRASVKASPDHALKPS
jgi:hypothetical protein